MVFNHCKMLWVLIWEYRNKYNNNYIPFTHSPPPAPNLITIISNTLKTQIILIGKTIFYFKKSMTSQWCILKISSQYKRNAAGDAEINSLPTIYFLFLKDGPIPEMFYHWVQESLSCPAIVVIICLPSMVYHIIYILGYKSRNLWPKIDPKILVRLIYGSVQ